jgi:NADPH2:quinone reductase
MPLRLTSLIRPDGLLELALEEVPMPRIERPDEVLLQVEAAPVNPSDLALLLAGADLGQARTAGTAERPVLLAPVPPAVLAAHAGRVGVPLPVGNEGAGQVIAAGEAPEAQALLGHRVAALGGGMYAQYRCVQASQCLPLPDGVSAAQGASSFINPLTALGMLETMRREGHTALVHTVGASNLGQMLLRLCRRDGVPLVNIVRRPEQADALRRLGAEHVVDSSSPTSWPG